MVSKEDHRHADLFGRHRPWQDDVSPCGFGIIVQGAVEEEVHTEAALAFTANMQTSLIGLEACSGAHFLGRALKQQGHDVRLIAAQFVKPFVKSNKNDFVDAEAVERRNMRFVPIKTDDQLDLQAMHRVRDRLVCRRTAIINQIRAFLMGVSFSLLLFTPKRARSRQPEK